MAALDIIYEDNHLIAVNKPGGLLVQGDKTHDRTLPDQVKDYIGRKYNKPGKVYLGLIHRLDRPVSGLVLFGRTSKATIRMNEAFRSKKIRKTYWAIVEREPPQQSDHLEGYLLKNNRSNKSFVKQRKTTQGKFSELEYNWLGSYDHYHLLEVLPLTGRHHQIRVMLSEIGCIIKGDLKYGAKKPNKDGNICLHARSLEFIHPVTKESMTLKAPAPEQKIWKGFSELM